jgi:hypothetical protein
MISKKRLYVDEGESFIIPTTCAFTVETRVVSADDPAMPNVHFHFIVIFIDGKKKILSGFNSIFDTLGISYIRSKF